MPTLDVTFDNGLNTARDASTISKGELVKATGCEYRPGSPHLYKQPGRASTSTALGAAVRALQYTQYETGTDKLVAVAGTGVYEGTPSSTPSFGSSVLTLTDSTAVPSFTCHMDRWLMCNGVDNNYLREPDGTWRTVGMLPPVGPPTASVSTTVGTRFAPGSNEVTQSSAVSGRNFTNTNYARDDDDTTASTFVINKDCFTSTDSDAYTIWYRTASTPVMSGNYYLYVDYEVSGVLFTMSGGQATNKQGQVSDITFVLSASTDGGSTFSAMHTWRGTLYRTKMSKLIAGVTNPANIQVKLTVTCTSYMGLDTLTCYVYGIYWQNNHPTGFSLTTGLKYTVTECYTDSDNLEIESAPPAKALSSSTGAVVSPTVCAAVTLTIPAKANSRTEYFNVYRTLDGGEFPTLYFIGKAPAEASGTTTWVDDMDIDPSDADAQTGDMLPMLTATYPDGSVVQFSPNDAPPRSSKVIAFQGSVVYIPSNVTARNSVYYSVPNTISARGIEQCPSAYYLLFQTPQNDSVLTATTCNNGRVLLVYFYNYTMLVTYLPQAADPNIFDTRVKEYITNSRGAGGTHCACEFDMGRGVTYAAAVDSKGVWVTDGVAANVIPWTDDYDWDTEFGSVALTYAQLVDNPKKRRLELTYTKSSAYYSLHFYYGRLKQSQDGHMVPLITGPHPVGYRFAHYANVAGTEYGWTGDSSTTGNVFNEWSGTTDASHGYDSSGNIPFNIKSGDMYSGGYGGAAIVECGYPKFGSTTTSKTVSLIGTFTRDGKPVTTTTTKSYNIYSQKKVYWHRYADRHTIEVTDLTTTSLPALVGYSIEVRPAGTGRDT